MTKNFLETLVGLLVIGIAVFFAQIIYKSNTNISNTEDTYMLKAVFDRIDGLDKGSAIKISGIKVGQVTELSLDYENYSAVVKFTISKLVKLPSDSSAEILSNGLLGDKYISISPGSEQEILKDGNIIEFTQSSINLENLISKFVFGSIENHENDGNGKEEDPNSISGDSLLNKDDREEDKSSSGILYQGHNFENSVS